MKTNQMRKAKAVYSEQELILCNSKGVGHHHLHFGRDSKAGRGVGKLPSGEKGGSGGPWGEVVGLGKLKVGSPEAGHPMWLVRGAHLAFSGWPQGSMLKVQTKIEAGSHESSPGHFDQLLEELLIHLLAGLLPGWHSSLATCVVYCR